MDLQQWHAGIVDKQGTNWPCTFWSRHQYEKTTISTMTGMFTSLKLHPQQKLIQNGRNCWHNFGFHNAWQKQVTVSVGGSNSLNNSPSPPQASEIPSLCCCYILYIFYRERNKVSNGPNLALYTVSLCDFILCRKSKYLPRHIKRKKTSRVYNLKRKLSSLEFTFSVIVQQHMHCWPSEHTAKHSCLYNLCTMRNMLCLIL